MLPACLSDPPRWSSRPWSDEIDAELILLGTGSTMPGKFRNVSSALLRFGGEGTPGGLGSIMLDAGEGMATWNTSRPVPCHATPRTPCAMLSFSRLLGGEG